MSKSTEIMENLPPLSANPTIVIYTNDLVVQRNSESKSRITRGGLLFPWKLQNMLNYSMKQPEGKGSSIVSWHHHGQSFQVHHVPDFVSQLLPLFFKQTKLKSFQRQLNLWGFLRIQDGPEKGAYYHKYFLRDRPSLVCLLERQKAGRKFHSTSTLSTTTATATTNKNQLEPTSIPMELTTTIHQQKVTITSSSTNISRLPTSSRQISIGSLESSDTIFEKWNLSFPLNTTNDNKNTTKTTSMITKKSTSAINVNKPESPFTSMKSTTTQPIPSSSSSSLLSNVNNLIAPRRVSNGLLEGFHGHFQKQDLPSIASLSTANTCISANTMKSHLIMPKRSVKIEQTIQDTLSSSSSINNNGPASATLDKALLLNGSSLSLSSLSSLSSSSLTAEGFEELLTTFDVTDDNNCFDPLYLVDFDFEGVDIEQFIFTPTTETNNVRQETVTFLKELEEQQHQQQQHYFFQDYMQDHERC